MTWLTAREVKWHELSKKQRSLTLIDFVNDNPVINQQNDTVSRYLGEESEIRELKIRIYENCLSLVKRFGNPNSAIKNNELHLKLMQFITEEVIKQHLRKMLNEDFYENSERDSFCPGCIHYPAHFYVARFDFWDDSIEFFDTSFKRSVYAEFYNEFESYERLARMRGEKVKRRRPVLLVNDDKFVKIAAIPCSSKPAQPEVKFRIPGRSQYSFAVLYFLFTVTPAMLKDKKNEFAGKIVRTELSDVIKNLPRRR
jgi:hypothetical protein